MGRRAATALVGYVRELVAAKRAHPADDLLSALVAARDGADRLTEDELTSMVFLLLVAGHETTVNLIGNGMYALLTHPDQLALLRAEPERLPATIEELLRFDGPVQVGDVPVDDARPCGSATPTIPAGEVVIPGLLAANRDPARIAEPDRVRPDPRRRRRRTSRSATACTTASARRWPASKAGSRWAACSPASPTCASPCPSPSCGGGPAC